MKKTVISIVIAAIVISEFAIVVFLLTPRQENIVRPTSVPKAWPPTWTPTPEVLYPEVTPALSDRCESIYLWAHETLANINSATKISGSIGRITSRTPASVFFDASDKFALLSAYQAGVLTTDDTISINKEVTKSFEASSMAMFDIGLAIISNSSQMMDRAIAYSNIAISSLSYAQDQMSNLSDLCGKNVMAE